MRSRSPVAKVRIVVDRDGDDYCLMSVKRSRDARSHGKLEMLGGHLDPGETPLEALHRELREEERTGRLAECLGTGTPSSRSTTVDGAVHHLFELRLGGLDVAALVPDPEESLGFELVRATELLEGGLDARLTHRTALMLAEFGPPPAPGPGAPA